MSTVSALPRLLALAALVSGGLGAQPAGGNPPSASPAPAAAGFTAVDPFTQAGQMRRGVNIIGYDPLWRNFDQARFKERHFQRIHDGGFQTVRVNLQAFSHMDASNRLDPAWFKTLDWVVKNALANRLTVILDEHDYTACASNAETCHARLMAFWEQVAEHYKDSPAGVLFELLNEPNGLLTPELWNAYLKDALGIVRRTNPKRNVVIGPASWNSIHYLDRLDLPADDARRLMELGFLPGTRVTAG